MTVTSYLSCKYTFSVDRLENAVSQGSVGRRRVTHQKIGKHVIVNAIFGTTT